MENSNLIIAYGSKNVSLNKGEQQILLTNEEMAFIIDSAIKNISLSISLNK